MVVNCGTFYTDLSTAATGMNWFFGAYLIPFYDCDFLVWDDTEVYSTFIGGYCNSGSVCGAFYINLYDLAINTYWFVGAFFILFYDCDYLWWYPSAICYALAGTDNNGGMSSGFAILSLDYAGYGAELHIGAFMIAIFFGGMLLIFTMLSLVVILVMLARLVVRWILDLTMRRVILIGGLGLLIYYFMIVIIFGGMLLLFTLLSLALVAIMALGVVSLLCLWPIQHPGLTGILGLPLYHFMIVIIITGMRLVFTMLKLVAIVRAVNVGVHLHFL